MNIINFFESLDDEDLGGDDISNTLIPELPDYVLPLLKKILASSLQVFTDPGISEATIQTTLALVKSTNEISTSQCNLRIVIFGNIQNKQLERPMPFYCIMYSPDDTTTLTIYIPSMDTTLKFCQSPALFVFDSITIPSNKIYSFCDYPLLYPPLRLTSSHRSFSAIQDSMLFQTEETSRVDSPYSTFKLEIPVIA